MSRPATASIASGSASVVGGHLVAEGTKVFERRRPTERACDGRRTFVAPHRVRR